MPGSPETIVELVRQELTTGPMNTLRLRLEMGFRDFIRRQLNIAFMRAADDQDKLNWLHEVGAILGTNEKVDHAKLTSAEKKYLNDLLNPSKEAS